MAARAGARCFITDPRQLPARLKLLPVGVLRWPEEANARLLAMGVRTLGELLRLPRAGFARRFGPAPLADLDRLLGRRADPRRRLTRRERYVGRVDLDHEIEDHERILEGCGLCSMSSSNSCASGSAASPRCNAVFITTARRRRRARCGWPRPKRMQSGCSRCCASGSPISGFPSRCGVANCAVARSRERPLASKPLWSAGERGHAPAGEMPALIEHLRARLGADAVYGLRCVSEHRPENAWRVAEPTFARGS